jgi:hypoxanthine-DNA glycosylase
MGFLEGIDPRPFLRGAADRCVAGSAVHRGRRVTFVRSFPPIADERARVLVLGSMPSTASLAAGQYYAHPHNAFWPIMGELFGAGPQLPYSRRTAKLRSGRVAVWDVLQSCVRQGSMDGDIEADSIVPNDFVRFFAEHRHVRAVFCNGGTAHACYRRLVLPALRGAPALLPVVRLPSTSPANASLRLPQKLARWHAVAEASTGTRP